MKDGNIAPATRSGYEAARRLFTRPEKAPSFLSTPEEISRFTAPSIMNNQEGIYMAYLTDPAAIARLLPPPLKPFAVPVVTLSVCHIHNPSFADDYYETILGIYAMMVGKRRSLLDYLAKKDINRYRAVVAKLGLRK